MPLQGPNSPPTRGLNPLANLKPFQVAASELLETQRHGLVLVCYARLAPAPYPIVLADAAPSALLGLAPYPIVLADAAPSALLALALSPIVLADALSPAILSLIHI